MAPARGQVLRGETDTDSLRANGNGNGTHGQCCLLFTSRSEHPAATARGNRAFVGYPLAGNEVAMNYREQIESAIRTTVFHSPTAYSWFGNLSPRLSLAIKRALTPQTARNYLLFNLQFQLYHDFYCGGVAAPARHEA